MSDLAAERAFQDEIIAHLTANGWLLGVSSDYDRERAIYPKITPLSIASSVLLCGIRKAG